MSDVLAHVTDPASTFRSAIRRYVRAAAILLLLSILGGALGEMVIPSMIVRSGDPTATAGNIVGSSLFRIGFAAYLVEAISDIALSLVFYVLLRPVSRELSLLAAFFGLVSTAVFAIGEAFYFAASVVLRPGMLASFSAGQRADLALFCLKVYGMVAGIFMALYGIAMLIRGVLVWRSGYLPRFLGALFVLGGLGFMLENTLVVLAPAFASAALAAPMGVAALAAMLWFFVRGPSMEEC